MEVTMTEQDTVRLKALGFTIDGMGEARKEYPSDLYIYYEHIEDQGRGEFWNWDLSRTKYDTEDLDDRSFPTLPDLLDFLEERAQKGFGAPVPEAIPGKNWAKLRSRCNHEIAGWWHRREQPDEEPTFEVTVVLFRVRGKSIEEASEKALEWLKIPKES